MNPVGSAFGSLNQISLDTPYRLLASVFGMLACVPDGEKPSGTLERVFTWLGIRANAHVHTVAEWLAVRAEVLAPVSWVMIALGAAAAVAWARRFTSPGKARAASTMFLGVALASELATWPDLGTVLLNAVILVALLGFAAKARLLDGDTFGVLAMDLVLSLGFAVLLPVLWTTSIVSHSFSEKKQE